MSKVLNSLNHKSVACLANPKWDSLAGSGERSDLGAASYTDQHFTVLAPSSVTSVGAHWVTIISSHYG